MTVRLGLVFTFNVSLETWRKQGLLDREKLIYERLLAGGPYGTILWFTYGAEDARYQSLLNDGISIVPMPRIFNTLPGKFLYSLLMPFVQARWFRRCAVIKTNQMAGSWTAVLAAKIHRKPLIVRTGFTWSRNAEKKRVRKLDAIAALAERFAYRRCEAAVVTDPAQARYVSDRYGLAPEKIAVVPNYIDTDAFTPSYKNSNYESSRAVYIGRLSEEKNLENLIAAFGGLPVGIDLIGDGPMRPVLEEKARSTGADARFLERVPNATMPAWLNRYPLFVLPSLFEGSPKSLLEAMACGLACLGSNVAGIREVIRHGENGWLVDVDAASIREGVRRLMEDGNLRDRMGKKARETVLQRYSLARVEELERAVHTPFL